jgi:hypothetical protein
MTMIPVRPPPLSTEQNIPPSEDRARLLLSAHSAALERRRPWEPLWQDCYAHVLPQMLVNIPSGIPSGSSSGSSPGSRPDRRGEALFDGTAPDAVDQLAASLLAQLTPPWSRWVSLVPGPDLAEVDRDSLAPLLDAASARLQGQFERSNLAVELHQCFLDAAIAGTACLLVEEAAPGAPSTLRFSAVPLMELVLDEGPEGRLDRVYRFSQPPLSQLIRRFGADRLPPSLLQAAVGTGSGRNVGLLETVMPDGNGWLWTAVLADEPTILDEGRFSEPPFIAFRWMKVPGEHYGRSPVMKALPDIRTANKVVELVLKNASIAVTGMWQADDDGVLNPAAIRLQPGAIIPKAVGSAGLTPLASPGRFDVSQLVLADLRSRIRHALLADRLGPLDGPRMTATEVIERTAEMARLLGATFGRLQAELLLPMVRRSLSILRRRGEVPDLVADGRLVEIQIQSPLARAQGQRDAEATLRWLESVAGLGPAALDAIDLPACARFLAQAAGVPSGLLKPVPGETGHV